MEMKVDFMTYFFWWCSGAEISILKDFPTEKNKYFGIGFTIFGTWILASVSGWYAFYTISSNNLFSIFLGLIWGLIIFNLDRYIISSMKKRSFESDNDYFLSERVYLFILDSFPSIPRILIALILGFTISKPIELKLFESEIAERIAIIHEAKVIENKALVDSYDKDINKINNEINALDSEYNEVNATRDQKTTVAPIALDLYDKQIENINNDIEKLNHQLSLEREKVIKHNTDLVLSGASLRKGYTRITWKIEQSFKKVEKKIENEIKDKKQKIQEVEDQKNNEEKHIKQQKKEMIDLNLIDIKEKIKIKESEIEKIKDIKSSELKKFKNNLSEGFLIKIEALSDLVAQNNAIEWTNRLIITLICLIETAPIIVKLISEKGPYDAMIEYINKSKIYYLEKQLIEFKKSFVEKSKKV